MSTRTFVTTHCDVKDHGEDEVPALNYRLGMSAHGKAWQWFEVDLCEPHAEALVGVVDGLTDQGRPFVDAPKVAASGAGAGMLACPECGQPYKSKAGLGIHRSKIHGVPGESRTPRAEPT